MTDCEGSLLSESGSCAIVLPRKILVLAIVLSLAACFREPRLKADTEADFDRSLAEVTKTLGTEDNGKLDAALRDIVLVQVGLYGPMPEAKSYQLPSSEPGAAFGQNLAEIFAGAGSKMIRQVTAAQWGENRAKLVVENARAIVDGRTAKEIISVAADERKKALESAIATYREQLEKAKSALNDIQAEAKNSIQRRNELKALLQKIQITKPRFFYQKASFMNEPVLSFTITNKGDVPAKRIFLEGTLQTPGRAVPWVKDSFNYEIPGGLEPNESQRLDLAPNMFSDWGKVPQDAVDGAVLTLILTAFEDASGKRFGQDEEDADRVAARRKALEDAIQELQRRIADLQKQLQ
jgi:hypothetical protein